jgi:2-hydroxy-4-carboxymuconate semialdehyde hemiacetal dehydrogenase
MVRRSIGGVKDFSPRYSRGVKFCLVGYGAIASKHMEAFREIPGVHPAWLVGRREEPTAEFAATWGFDNWTLDLDRALADPGVDAVVITSPNALHAGQAERSLRAGKHVLCEIPLALSLEDAERITEISRSENRRLMVAHTMRFFPAIRELQDRVESGALHVEHLVGQFTMVRRRNVTADGKPRSWTDNLLWHHGAHMVDAVLWITGSLTADVFCRFGAPHPTQGILNLTLSMGMPGGQIATIAQSYGSYEFRWRLDVFAEEATLLFDMGELRDSDGKVLVPRRSIVDLRDQNREFVAAVREGRDPAVTGEDVLPTMRMLHNAQASAEG